MKEFIEYWDEVISQWAKGDGSVKSVPESERVWFDRTNTNLISEYMPEPYWGNPEKNSVVLLNFNPGGDREVKSGAYCHKNKILERNTFVSEIYPKYSKIALEFPWCNESGYPDFMGKEKCNSSIKWVNQRLKWINRIMNGIAINKNHKPFFIEVCAWHSKNWRNVKFINTKRYDATPLINKLKEILLPILIYCIPRSDLGIGLCIGKQFATQILPAIGFDPLSDIYKPIDEIGRFYQFFNYGDVKILCTWSSAGYNVPPNIKFSPFEIDMISKCV